MTTSGLIQLIAIFQITSNSSVGPWKQFAIGIAMHRGIGSGTWISLRRALMEVTWFWQNVCRLGLIGRKRLCLLYIQYIQYIYIYAGHHMTNYSILMILMCLLKLFFLVYIYIYVCVCDMRIYDRKPMRAVAARYPCWLMIDSEIALPFLYWELSWIIIIIIIHELDIPFLKYSV